MKTVIELLVCEL